MKTPLGNLLTSTSKVNDTMIFLRHFASTVTKRLWKRSGEAVTLKQLWSKICIYMLDLSVSWNMAILDVQLKTRFKMTWHNKGLTISKDNKSNVQQKIAKSFLSLTFLQSVIEHPVLHYIPLV